MAAGWLLPGLLTAAGSIYGYASRPRTPKFSGTPQGRRLKMTAQEGMFPKGRRTKMLGLLGQTTGNAAQLARERIRGSLIGSGMNRSIAGARALNAPLLERMRIMGRRSTELDLENELSKARAGDEFARMDTQFGMQRAAEDSEAKRGLVSGLVTSGAQTLLAKKYPEMAPFMAASQAGVRLPYYAGKGLMGGNNEIPQFSNYEEMKRWALANLPADKAKLLIADWLLNNDED